MQTLQVQTSEEMIQLAGAYVYSKSWVTQTSESSPIVLLHDSLGCVELWKDFPRKLCLATNRRVIAYDRIGFGKSSPLVDLPKLSFIEDESNLGLAACLERYQIDCFYLLGHSVGGSMSICAASKLKQCLGVISISAQSFVEKRTVQGLMNAMKLFAKPGQLDRLIKYHADKANWVLKAWLETWLNKKFQTWNLGPVLVQVQCPILVIHGEDDEYGSTAFVDFIAARAESVESHILADCAHLPHREKEETVLKLIQSFLLSIPSKPKDFAIEHFEL